MASDRRKILVLNRFLGGGANVYRDFLFSFNAYSRHDFYYLHKPSLVESLDLRRFDAVLLFWACDWVRPSLSDTTIARIAESPAKKLLFTQDEYRNVAGLRRAVNRFGVEQVFTVMHPSAHDDYFPRSECPGLRDVQTVLTGYVPENLASLRPAPHADRPIDVAYRSRTCPYYLGALGQEKGIIAERFTELARRHGLSHDISVWEGDRLYGRAYVRFLQRARCVLGTESGASVVDFSGELQARCERYVTEHPQATFDEVRQKFFADWEGKIHCRAVSPRVFESIALGNALVLHEGDYSDVLVPHRHYFPVKKDYSNADDVVAFIRDHAACERMAQRAREEVVVSGRYSYRTFVRDFDDTIETCVPQRAERSPTKAAFYARNFWRHGQGIIPHGASYVRVPNVDWIGSTARGLAKYAGLRLVRRFTTNGATAWGLRSSVRRLLTSSWEKLPQRLRDGVYPIVRPLRRSLDRTVFKPF